MANSFILVVDDEEDILELVRYNLSKNGYEVDGAATGEEALSKVRDRQPDLIVLDLMLPGIDGLDVCKMLKADPKTEMVPIIMLTAKSEDADIVAGLELGADDYVVKPFSPRVLLARLRAVLRRHHKKPENIVERGLPMVKSGEIEINMERYEVRASGNLLSLTATEFAILHFLISNPGRVYTRNQIIEGVKGDDYPVTERSVDVQIVALRKKLGESGSDIETVRGIGYRFKDSE